MLLWPGKEADGSLETTTPSKSETRDEMGRLEKVRQSPSSTVEQNLGEAHILACEEARTWGHAKVGVAGQACIPENVRNSCGAFILTLSRVVGVAKCNEGGDREIEQPLSLYRLASL